MDRLKEVKRVEIKQWAGEVTNADARDIAPENAQICSNLQPLKGGVLSVRRGIPKNTNYTASSPTATDDCIAAYGFQHPLYDRLITQHITGSLKARRGNSASTTIETGRNTYRPLSMFRMRNGDLIGVDGISRGFRWDGITSLVEELGMDAPTVAPSATSSPGSGDLTYRFAYRYIDDTLPDPIPSSISPIFDLATASVDDEFNWLFTAPTQARASLIELYRTLADDASVLYLVATLPSVGTVTNAIQKPAGTTIRITSPAHGLLDGAKITISGVVGTTEANGIFFVDVIDATTFDLIGSTFTNAYVSGGTWVIIGYNGDDFTDDELDDEQRLNIVDADGSANSLQYEPPPNYMSVVVQFQDRAVYAVPVNYVTGTVATNGSTTITGTGTNWNAAMVGRYLYIAGEPAPLVISAFGSTVSLTVETAAASSASGLTYSIAPEPTVNNQLLISQPDKPEAVPIINEILIQQNTPDDDRMTGLIPFGSHLFACKERHIYRVAWVRQPAYDASVSLHAYRGLLNQRCWATFEGTAYVMDRYGIYALTLGGAEPISQPIADLWRDGTLDLSDTTYWFAQADPEQHRVRFHVNFTSDTTDYPCRWLEYDCRAGQWYRGMTDLPSGLGCSATIAISGRQRVLVGGEDDIVYTFGEGKSDVVATAIAGTATSSSGTTLVDSAAPFGSTGALIKAVVYIVDGTGKGQRRVITGSTSTTLTVATWTTNPDTTSKYVVGGVEYQWLSKVFEYVPRDEENKQDSEILFEPTTYSHLANLRTYLNRSDSASIYGAPYRVGTAWRADGGDDEAELETKLSDYLGSSTGAEKLPSSGSIQNGMRAVRFVEYELQGVQGLDEVKLYALNLSGVQ